MPVIIVILMSWLIFKNLFLIARANSTDPAPPPIKAIDLKLVILFKKLFVNFDIGFTGRQYLAAPFISRLLL